MGKMIKRRLLHVVLIAGMLAQLPAMGQTRPQIQAPPPPPEPPGTETPAKPQQPPPGQPEADEVQLTANLVTVTVAVRDRSGALVTDLTPADFAVYEDGRPQDVDQFAKQGEVPLRLVLLFDTSLSVKNRIAFERRAAARFFTEVLKPGDQAALYSVSTDWK